MLLSVISILFFANNVNAQRNTESGNYINEAIMEGSFDNLDDWELNIISGTQNWKIENHSSVGVRSLQNLLDDNSTWIGNVAYFSASEFLNQDTVQNMEATLTWTKDTGYYSAVPDVIVSWHQLYVASNYEKLYFEYSKNGTDWTIYNNTELYPNLEANNKAEEYPEILIKNIENHNNLMYFRFRWKYNKAENTTNTTGAGYGWIIDDIKITTDCSYISVNENITNASTSLSNNGAISLSISDSLFYGNPEITWSNGDSTSTISNLANGTYTVTVKDDQSNCTYSNSYIITDTCKLELSIDTMFAASGMNTNDGMVAINVDGAVGAISYNWSNSSTNDSLLNVQTGVYSVEVSDNGGCIRDIPYIYVKNNCNIQFNNSITRGDTSDTIEITVTQGVAPYQYQWSNSESGNSIIAPKGDYSVTITDANGCSVTSNINSCLINVDFTLVNPTNADSSNGSITSIVTNQSGNVNYLWSTSITESEISNINQGIYTVTISDETNCTINKTIFLSSNPDCKLQIIPTIINPTWNFGAIDDGSIEITVMNGKQPFNYLWNNGETTSKIENLNPSNYSVYVYDAEYCADYWSTRIATNIKNIEKISEINIYPNPSNGELFIENTTNSTISIYNILGEKINEFDVYSNIQKNINLNTGLYIFVITESDNVFSKKIIIQN